VLSVTPNNPGDGGNLTYQWYRAEGQSGGRFVPIPGATGNTFRPDTSEAGTNRYRVVVTNTTAGRTASRTTSRVAVVTIAPMAGAPAPTQEQLQAPTPLLRFDVGSYTFTHNGITLQSDVAPFIDPAYDRLMVPLRLIAEAMGADVEWVHEIRSVNISDGMAMVSLTIGVPLPDGMGVPIIVNDRTLVPLRYVAEILGADVYWDGASRAVYVYEQTRPFDVSLANMTASASNLSDLFSLSNMTDPDYTPKAIIDRTALEAIEWALEAFDDNADDEPEPEVAMLKAMLFAGLGW